MHQINSKYHNEFVKQFPKDWEIKQIGTLFNFSKKPKNLEINDDDIIHFIAMKDIPENGMLIKNWEDKKRTSFNSGTFAFKNDLVIAKITPCFENGKQAILDNIPSDYCYLTTEVFALNPKQNKNITYFIFYYLRRNSVRAELAGKMTGTTGRQRLPKDVMKQLSVPIPPKDEQTKIVSFLNIVRNIIEKTRNVISSTIELKKSLLHHLFTYGPVPIDQRDSVELQETAIGFLPKEWEITTFDQLATMYTGGTPSRKKDEYWNGDIPWAKSGELNNSRVHTIEEKITQLGLENSNAKYVEPGTLLIALYGATAGKVGIAKTSFTINQAICAIRNNDFINPEFYFYYFMFIREDLLSKRFGGAQPNLNQQIIKNTLVPKIPIEIQNKIAKILTTCDNKIESEKEKKIAMEELFRTLLEKLMMGQIRVYDLNLEEIQT